VAEQLELAKKRVAGKVGSGKFLAYFQAFTNTYAPVDILEKLYFEAADCPDVVGISIATRPDCLPQEVLSLLERLNRRLPVYVELGLQTVHARTAAYIRRGFDSSVYYEAVDKLRAIGIHVVTHIILGLPGETADMAAETTRCAVDAGTDGVKFHLLHVLRGTDLEKDYVQGRFACLTLEEYGQWLCRCISELPPDTVVHRITGDGAKRDLIAPLWSGDKKRVLNYLHRLLTSELPEK